MVTHSDQVHEALMGRNPAVGNHCLIGTSAGLLFCLAQISPGIRMRKIKNKATRPLKQMFPQLVLNEAIH